jgi:hypothetical protein
MSVGKRYVYHVLTDTQRAKTIFWRQNIVGFGARFADSDSYKFGGGAASPSLSQSV